MMLLGNRISRPLVVLALCAALPCSSLAKGYSSGGHSYSSHSSSSHSSGFSSSRSSSGSSTRSSSSSGSKSFSSSPGKNYSSGSNWSDTNRKGYSSSKSYTSDSGKTFRPAAPGDNHSVTPSTPRKDNSGSGGFAFDTAAARARKEEASKEQFTQYKQSQAPRSAPPNAGLSGSGQRPSAPGYGGGPYRRSHYVPDVVTISTRPVRIYNVFNSYSSRPWITYHDPYNSLFWWWLLDRSLDDRAWWAYHHRYDMDPARYDALVANDAQLQSRVAQLEAQQVARDPAYVPPGLEGRDLMYSDQYVKRAYSNRPTMLGVIAFWLFGIPMAVGICGFFIWLIWFKRWQTAT